MNEEQLTEIIEQTWKMVDIWIGEGKDPLAISAALTSSAMKLYKTILSAEDYDRMMDAISDNRGAINRLGESRGIH